MINDKLTNSQLKVIQKFEDRLRYIFLTDVQITKVETGIRFSKYYIDLPLDCLDKLNEHKSDFAVLTEKCYNVEFCIENDSICVYVQNEDFNEKNITYFDLVDSDEYKNTNAVLPVPVGKDFYGKVVISDLRELAYLMCVGFVGSGIFEFIEGMVFSLTNKYDPSQFKLMLIESKNYSLKTFDVFEELPHLLGNKIFKTEEEIYEALDAVVGEIDRRVEVLTKMGTPNIDVFNNCERVRSGLVHALPYVVVVINKFENVISLNQTKIEKYIQILTGKAKACGVNLVICTEKPTDDVLTKVVLRHVISRLFFKTKVVSSKYLSLMAESELLFNNGDMLLVPFTTKKPQRLQYGYINYNECSGMVKKIVNKYKK